MFNQQDFSDYLNSIFIVVTKNQGTSLVGLKNSFYKAMWGTSIPEQIAEQLA